MSIYIQATLLLLFIVFLCNFANLGGYDYGYKGGHEDGNREGYARGNAEGHELGWNGGYHAGEANIVRFIRVGDGDGRCISDDPDIAVNRIYHQHLPEVGGRTCFQMLQSDQWRLRIIDPRLKLFDDNVFDNMFDEYEPAGYRP